MEGFWKPSHESRSHKPAMEPRHYPEGNRTDRALTLTRPDKTRGNDAPLHGKTRPEHEAETPVSFFRWKLDLGTKIPAQSQLTFVNGNTITQSRNPFDMGHITSSRQRPAFSGVLTHDPIFSSFLVFIIPLSVTVGGEKAFKALYWHACEARRGEGGID